MNLSQEELNNNSFIYYDQISQQGTSRALACHINNCNYSDEGGIPQGHWYFPNGEIVPFKTQGSLFSVVVERQEGELLLQWLGHPSQTGHYFCKGAKFNSKPFYIHIGKILGHAIVVKRISYLQLHTYTQIKSILYRAKGHNDPAGCH